MWVRPLEELGMAPEKSQLCDTVMLGHGLAMSLEYWRAKYAAIISFFILAMVDEYEMSTAALGLSSTTV